MQRVPGLCRHSLGTGACPCIDDAMRHCHRPPDLRRVLARRPRTPPAPPGTPTMPPSPYPRNTFVYDANVPQGDRPLLVAGFMQLGRTTGEDVYFCLGLCFAQPRAGEYRLLSTTGTILPRDGTIVTPGTYSVVTAGFPLPFPSFLKYSGPARVCVGRADHRDRSTTKYFRGKSRY